MKKSYIGLGIVVVAIAIFFGGNFYVSSQTEKGLKDSLDSGNVSYDEATCSSVFFDPTCTIKNMSSSGAIFEKVSAKNVGALKNVAEGKDGLASFDFLFEGITIDPTQSLVPMRHASEEETRIINEMLAKTNFFVGLRGDFEIKNKDIVSLDPFVIKLGTKNIELDIKLKANQPSGIVKSAMMTRNVEGFNYLHISLNVKNRDGLIDTIQEISTKVNPNQPLTKEKIKSEMEKFKPELMQPKNQIQKKFANALTNLVQGKSNSLTIEAKGENLANAIMMLQVTQDIPAGYDVSIKN